MKTIRRIKAWAWRAATGNCAAQMLGLKSGTSWDEAFWKPRFERLAKELNICGFATEKPANWKTSFLTLLELREDLAVDLEALDTAPAAA